MIKSQKAKGERKILKYPFLILNFKFLLLTFHFSMGVI